ncbi:hypothetical protein BaRGS_00011611 [Batillaria attramentaria]|uniref:Spindle pole body-associated protein cut12 domain-containing protein n=1 Tax=Batillaria attramentaria TaxID=370345 RepID=A0ABD0LC83_9CAEN
MDKFKVQCPSKSEKYATVRSKAEEKKLTATKSELDKMWQTETRYLKTTRNRFVIDRRQSMGNVYNSEAEGSPQQFLRSKTNRRESDSEILDIFRKQADRRQSVKKLGTAVTADTMRRLEEKYQKALAESGYDVEDDESEAEEEVLHIPGDGQLSEMKVVKSDTFVIESESENVSGEPKPTTAGSKIELNVRGKDEGTSLPDTISHHEREDLPMNQSDVTCDAKDGESQRKALPHSVSVQHKPTRLDIIKSGADRGRSYSDGDVATSMFTIKTRLQNLGLADTESDATDNESLTASSGTHKLHLKLGADSDTDDETSRTPPHSPNDSSPVTPTFKNDVRRLKDNDVQVSPLLMRRSLADDAFGSPRLMSADDVMETPRPIYQQRDAAFGSPRLMRRTEDAPDASGSVFQYSGPGLASPNMTHRTSTPLDVGLGSPRIARRKKDTSEKPKPIYQQSSTSPFASPRTTRRKRDVIFTPVPNPQPNDAATTSPKMTQRRKPVTEAPKPIYLQNDVKIGSPPKDVIPTSDLQSDVTATPRRRHRRSRSEAIDLQTLLAHREVEFPEIGRLKRRGSDSCQDSGLSRKPPKAWGSLMYELALNDAEREEVARAKRMELVTSLRKRQLELDNDVSQRIQTFLQRYGH